MDPFDLATLFAHRGRIEGLDPAGTPELAVFGAVPSCRMAALLPGSFNPPTAAHLMLAERALRDGYDCVLFVLARTTAGKKPNGLLPEDRLMAMRALCDDTFAVAVSSHALYADQARAAAAVFPGAELSFLVGSDKVIQIFDPAWYQDRDAALEQLFSRARLVVAPRSDQSEALRACLQDPANARWADRIEILRLHPAVGDLSSTHVRGMLRAGAEPGGLVPPAVAAFLTQVRAFAPPVVVGGEDVDPYEMRARLLHGLHDIDAGAMRFDLRALTELAVCDSLDGEQLRAALRADEGNGDVLSRALAIVRP